MEITGKAIIALLTGASIVAAGVSFISTKWFDSYAMKDKFRLIVDARKCMEERAEQEKAITGTLEKMQKRLMLGNLMLLRLWRKAEIPNEEIKAMEHAISVQVDTD